MARDPLLEAAAREAARELVMELAQGWPEINGTAPEPDEVQASEDTVTEVILAVLRRHGLGGETGLLPPLPVDRGDWGRVVREAWMAWAREQPDLAEHPSWLVPWEDLPHRDREADERIAAAVLAEAQIRGGETALREALHRLRDAVVVRLPIREGPGFHAKCRLCDGWGVNTAPRHEAECAMVAVEAMLAARAPEPAREEP